MNEISKEQQKNLKIYREFFEKAEVEVKKQLAELKDSSLCENCRQCCKIRYSEFSPAELKKIGYGEFLETFIPLSINFADNHKEALILDKDYAEKVLENTNRNCWFYTCKNYKNNECLAGKEKPLYCTHYPQTAYTVLHNGCGFKQWQIKALNKLEKEMAKDILERIQAISEYKKSFNCACCATCCKLACSEFSYEELKEKAKNGDKFAIQFTSVFVPYSDEKEAYKYYSEYIDYLRETLGKDEKTYFYYCPKNKENLCTDYENRPDICREFPTNPLMILPKICGYKAWQEETHTPTLLLHALVEIVDFYIKKIKKILEK